MKILIFGIPGSGKTVLANQLSKKTGISVFHIDRHFFEPGKKWKERPQEEFLKDVENVLRKDEWIIDGNGMRTLEMRYKEADLVIFCALPRLQCLFRIFKRAMLSYIRNEQRVDSPKGAGHVITLRLIKYLWNFRRRYSALIQSLQVRYPNVKFIEIGSGHELNEIDIFSILET